MSGKGKTIFLVVGSFKSGGTERTASRIGLELIKRGYSVTFLLINGVFDYDDFGLKENSVILSPEKRWSRVTRFFLVYLKLFKLVYLHRPDKLVSFSLGINKLIFFLFYPKTIFRIESNIFIYKKKLYRRYLQKYMVAFPHVRKVVVPSEGLFQACKAYFGKSGEKLVQVNNPIDTEKIEKSCTDFESTDFLDQPFIVSAGRLSKSKGFEALIDAFSQSQISRTHRLLILGEGELHQKLMNQINTNGLDSRVKLLGFVKNPYPYFSKAFYFILNTSHESFGNVFIESFAAGTLVISNDCDFGPRHIIEHEKNGILYDSTNFENIVESLDYFIDRQELYSEMKLNAYASRFKYSIETTVDDWLKKITE
ncbi:glycosyltransferase involved in cell wall biosynthesis [Roseivirga pacifica]|uniref:Glycosyltransferase involved in cell wall bisynthesis n=1 Tax=Roseivirga pacifica TaxID=1267423 RepID=A0A1I0QZ18_9BACT|nr:glycosyltransferase [Roseivirga pacifica]RKQ42304.1 glycosyltransferase involved in cell wall biosynthesis [Roseivirga pacifica]SEW33170.1 Glycosyltransferase involved in cell wall bisynthesis [Roseivirga pacifica]